MKIAILGGSFNPVHNGHLSLVDRVIKERLVDEVWLMPCKKHAFDKYLESSANRAEMIKLAIANRPQVKISYLEITQNGKNYTYDTLNLLRKMYTRDFSFIIGSDILEEIPKWHKYEELIKEAEFILFKRKGYRLSNPGINITATLNLEEKDISSTDIRERVRRGKPISKFVTKAVEEYIFNKGLYISK